MASITKLELLNPAKLKWEVVTIEMVRARALLTQARLTQHTRW
jgi:hypothetical protein